jgi:hypothetical protein
MTTPPLAPVLAGPRNINVSTIVEQAIAVLQQTQSQAAPPPATMPRDLLATAEILGEEPGLRRPPKVAGTSVFAAWTSAATAAGKRHVIVRGNGQMAPVGGAVRLLPTILVTDGFGRPVAGANVVFSVEAGNGTAPVAPVASGLDGLASLPAPGWTLGPNPGQNDLQATVDDVPGVTFSAFGIPSRVGAPHRGDGQQAPVNKALAVSPAVRVVDAGTGQPVPSVDVAFSVTAGGGRIANAAAVTDSDGIASPGVWTVGSTRGPQQLQATAAGANPVTFNAVAI